MITRQQKIEQLTELSNQMREAKSTIFVEFTKITVEDAKKIRWELRESWASMKVIKKTLIKKAAKDTFDVEIWDEQLNGQIAVICSNEELVAGPKIMKKYSKDLEIKLTWGIFEENLLSQSQATELANLPSKEELIAKMLWSFMSPIQGFYSANKAVLSWFARVLDGHRENLAEG